jgi:hypothetical protein
LQGLPPAPRSPRTRGFERARSAAAAHGRAGCKAPAAPCGVPRVWCGVEQGSGVIAKRSGATGPVPAVRTGVGLARGEFDRTPGASRPGCPAEGAQTDTARFDPYPCPSLAPTLREPDLSLGRACMEPAG